MGFWQLERAAEKVLFLEKLEERTRSPVIDWSKERGVEGQTHRPFRLTGTYTDRSFLLDNRISEGKPGYDVLSLFRLVTGEIVLLNRGWIKAGKYRQTLPDIDSPNEIVMIEGHFYLPEGEIPILKDTPEEMGWPKRIQQVQWELIESSANVGAVVRSEFRLANEQQAGAYRTGWPKTVILPAKHMGYAYQWFGLSIALVLLTVFASIKIIKNRS